MAQASTRRSGSSSRDTRERVPTSCEWSSRHLFGEDHCPRGGNRAANGLNDHRQQFLFRQILKIGGAVRIQIASNDIADINVMPAVNFNDGVIAGFDFDNEVPVLKVDEYDGAFQGRTSQG